MNALAERIRFWLIRSPKPARVRVTVDGSQSIVQTAARVNWARVAETIEALEPDLIEALDGAENLIRATKPTEIELDTDDSDTATDGAPKAATAAPLVGDPETQRMQIFAGLIAEAYRQAQDLTGVRNDAAFNRMIDLVEAISRRAELGDKARDAQAKQIERLMAENIKLSIAHASKGDGGEPTGAGLLDELISRFAKGAGIDLGGDDEPPDEPAAEPAAPNGKGH